MEHNKSKNRTTRFLVCSFVGLIVFSIFSFSFLALYMTKKSHESFYKIGQIYMSGMSEQISSHFESVIQLRFNQVSGLVSVVPADNPDTDTLYKELVYRARVREFDYLALCSADGSFETLYGKLIQPLNPEPFVEALVRGEQRVAIGVDSDGNEVVLFGVDANYPMSGGNLCTGLVAAVPLEYITDFLALDKEDQMLSFCIIRNDGSVVVSNSNIGLEDSSQRLPELLSSYDDSATAYSAEAFDDALQNNRSYVSTIAFNGEEQTLHSAPLSHSEWNLISIMPYNQLNGALDMLNAQRTKLTVLSCLSVLIFMILIFIGYFRMTTLQLRELEESRRKATEATKAKSEFLANMSHDIRTPMNAIVGMTAIATTHIDDLDQVKSCLRKIALSSKQLLGLINDVLDMSKIESGKMTLSTENASLKDLFDGIVSIMQPQINIKKQSFDVHIENVVTENVWCDGVRLNQVLLNLLSNATKYTPEGGNIRLSLFEERSPKGENYARMHIIVKDNGIGMTPEFLEKIYESYSRADGNRIHKIEGAGLGMAITKYIVDAMEGTIDVQSEPNKGTEFHLVFDFEKAPAIEVDMVLPAWNMLMVDDDELLCKSTIDVLKGFGIHAEWTLSGENAIALAIERHEKRNDYQIILLDWKLPGINGIDAAREIRQHMGQDIPILLISAYDWTDIEDDARTAGINGFICKPLFKSTLYYGLRPYADIDDDRPQTNKKTTRDFTGKKILLAEDNDLNWEIAETLLSDEGLELDWAENGQVCVEIFQQSEIGYYDAILMDIRMPVMNGYDAAKTIRSLDRPDATEIPIIAMTADAFAEDIQHCLDVGMNAHIAKPIDVHDVLQQLDKFMR